MVAELSAHHKHQTKAYRNYSRYYLKRDSSINSLLRTVQLESERARWKKAFHLLMSRDRVLDLGSGLCWASYLLAKHGCKVVSIDFNLDDVVRLRAGSTLSRNTGVHFERVAGDISRLPFASHSFDAVHCSAVLHHVPNSVGKVIREVNRVLKNDGIMVATCEHNRGIFLSEEKFQSTQRSVLFGVDEHALTYFEYARAFRNADMRATFLYDPAWEDDICHARFNSNSIRGCLARVSMRILGPRHAKELMNCGIIRKILMMLVTLALMIVARKENKVQLKTRTGTMSKVRHP